MCGATDYGKKDCRAAVDDIFIFLFKSLFHVGNKYSISYIYLYKITNKIQLINE